MKQFYVILMLSWVASLPAAGDEPTAQPGASGSLTRWHAPGLGITKDSETPIIPLAKLVDSVQVVAEPQEVFLNDLRGIVVSVHNTTDRPVVVDADKASAIAGGVTYHSAVTKQVDKAACPQNIQPARAKRAIADVVLAGVTVGAFQTARDAKLQKGPVLNRYGCDESRRHDEAQAFGSRVVWPGDTRKGIVYFAAPSSLHGASVIIPVRALYDPSDAALVGTTL